MKSLRMPSVLILALVFSAAVYADLEPIAENGLSNVTGEGLAILPNINVIFDLTSYLHIMPRGQPKSGIGWSLGGGGPSVGKQGDLYYYGLSFSRAEFDAPGGALNRVSNPNTSVYPNWGSAGNPWVFLATSPTLPWNNAVDSIGSPYPVLQYRAPTYAAPGDLTNTAIMNMKYAFVGDIAVCGAGIPTYGSTAACGGRTPAAGGVLRSINVWDGFSFNGSSYSIFQTTVDYGKYVSGSGGAEFYPVGSTPGTFGAVWLNRINSAPSGIYRFGVGGGVDVPTVVPETTVANLNSFNANEGVWITDMDFNMPIGHLHYQPLIFDAESNGNMVLEVVRIPNNSNVYNYAYCNYGANNAGACANHASVAAGGVNKTCRNDSPDCTNATHGQVSFGTMEFRNNAGSYTPGTSTLACNSATGCVAGVSKASVLIDGIFIQHMKIKTLGL